MVQEGERVVHHIRISGAINCKVYLHKDIGGAYSLVKTGDYGSPISGLVLAVKEQAIEQVFNNL